MNSKVSQAFGPISLDVRVGPASPAGRPQPASAGRRSWELVLALTPPSVFFVYSKKIRFIWDRRPRRVEHRAAGERKLSPPQTMADLPPDGADARVRAPGSATFDEHPVAARSGNIHGHLLCNLRPRRPRALSAPTSAGCVVPSTSTNTSIPLKDDLPSELKASRERDCCARTAIMMSWSD